MKKVSLLALTLLLAGCGRVLPASSASPSAVSPSAASPSSASQAGSASGSLEAQGLFDLFSPSPTSGSTQSEPDFGRKNILLTADEIRGLSNSAGEYDGYLRSCAANLDYAPSPVSDLRSQPVYSSDGQTSTPDRRLSNDSNMAYRFAVCYLVSKDKRYAGKTEQILDAWAKTLSRVSTEQGRYEVNFNFPRMVLAANWVKPANEWDSRSFDSLLRRVVLPQSTSGAKNNHGFWGVLLETTIGAHLGDTALLRSARSRFESLLLSAVASDGSMPLEITRSATSNWNGGPDKGIKGLAYTHYALLPAAVTAKILADRGQAMWTTEGGKKLRLAFRKAAACTLNPETFPYYKSNDGQLIGVNNGSYFPLLLRYYTSPEATEVVATKPLQANSFLLVELFR